MTAFLDGIAAQFYRGIGSEVQYIAPFSRMNFFIGANNSGKSIVLSLISSQLSQLLSEKASVSLDETDSYRGKVTGQFVIAVGRRVDSVVEDVLKNYSNGAFLAPYGDPRRANLLVSEVREILRSNAAMELVWVTTDARRGVRLFPEADLDSASGWTQQWQKIWNSFTGRLKGGLKEHWIPQTLEVLARMATPCPPPAYLIPAKRVLGGKEEAFDDLSGKGLIDHLATLQNPKWNRQEDREKFERINKFLREVTAQPTATLEVPSGREHLLVHMNNKVLPLSSLGTGIHDVVLIAAFCTIHDGSIMCIEEPEIHLHPLLQRKLVRYLVEHTSSQYFIATHSSAFIDTPDANVFHVANDGEQTRVTPVLTRQEQRRILDDLGAQASDILQANAVVWVEGPSDRIYINHWMSAMDSRLKEGIHYTIMFYGGALLRHLSASDHALDDFIKLRDLNRNMAVVIDSDLDSPTSSLKENAERLRSEMTKYGGVVWVTAGREIENYIDGERLQAALKKLHPHIYKAPCSAGQFDHAFYFMREDPKKPERRKTYKEGDKLGAARLICAEAAQLDILDLRARLGELVAMIYKANGLAGAPSPR